MILILFAAFSDLEDDLIQQIDLQEVRNQMEFNGLVSSLRDSFFMNPSNPEMKEVVQKLLAKLEDE